MLKGIVDARALGDYRVHVVFEDGVEGEVDVSALVPFEGVFAPLREPQEFARLTVNHELGTICWLNGADLDPDVLYALVSQTELPSFKSAFVDGV